MEDLNIKFERILLGATTDGTLAFANIDFRSSNGELTFSASFNEFMPFLATHEYLEEMAKSNIDCLDKSELFNLCKEFDCRPSELVKYYMNNKLESYGVEGLIIDKSLYAEHFTLDKYDDNVYFKSVSCEQNDIRHKLIPIDNIFNGWIHYFWDNFNLKEIDECYLEEIQGMIDLYYKQIGSNEDWIQAWLENVEL